MTFFKPDTTDGGPNADKIDVVETPIVYYTITSSVVGSGALSFSPSGGTYEAGTQVTITPIADTGHQFDGWSGDVSGSDDPMVLTVNSEVNLTATFSEIWVELAFDDFEINDWGNYTGGGNNAKMYSGGTYAHNGDYALNIEDNKGESSSIYLINGIDADSPGYTQIKVEFWFYSVSLEPGESYIFKFYDGAIWHDLQTYVVDVDFVNDQFYFETIIIDEANYTFASDMNIKFTCDASGGADDIYIDEIRISAKGGSSNRMGQADILQVQPSTDIHAYPNPFGDQFTIQFTSTQKQRIHIELISMTGVSFELLTDYTIGKGVFQQSFLLAPYHLPAGIYFVNILTDFETKTLKLIKR